jgi:hypothetical protein
VAVTYLDHYRVAGRRIAEVWEVCDGLSLQEQFSIITGPEAHRALTASPGAPPRQKRVFRTAAGLLEASSDQG